MSVIFNYKKALSEIIYWPWLGTGLGNYRFKFGIFFSPKILYVSYYKLKTIQSSVAGVQTT